MVTYPRFMIHSRHSAIARALTVFLLLVIGADLGAHGLLAADWSSAASGNASARLDAGGSGARTNGAGADHCFCHSVVNITTAAPRAGDPVPIGALVLDPSCQPTQHDPNPLDRPPQFLA